MIECPCRSAHPTRRVVLTGGPGAGKTAVLELVRQSFCEHVRVLPESAGIVFGGGFPRQDGHRTRIAAQRAIFFVQRELERTREGENDAVVLCDRGTVDGFAYWPGPDDMWRSLGTTHEEQLARYHMVIHLRTPGVESYNRQNPLRIESAEQAADIDRLLEQAWDGHPRRIVVPAAPEFLTKAERVMEILRDELPACCRAVAAAGASAGSASRLAGGARD